MSLSHNPSIATDGIVFAFDAKNPKCYAGAGTSFNELISKTSTTAIATSSLLIVDGSLRFTPAGTSRTAYIPFNNSDIIVPTGQTGSWTWFQKFEDQGSIDHPNFGKETGSGWDGVNGFVFGTGWGTDGPRWGIGGTAYTIYSTADPDYVANVWQCWTVTYNGGAGNNANGLKTYLNGNLIDSRTAVAANIGSNTNQLFIGATNSRGGNWGGYMDTVFMWNTELNSTQVAQNFNALRGRYGI